MKRLPTMHVLAIAARWGSWLLVVALLWSNDALRPLDGALWLWIGFVYITSYAAVWTWLLPRLLPRISDGSVVVLYDLALSALPIWISGSWNSPFLPFALSVIVVPAARRGWRSGMLIAAMFLALDQIMLWSSAINPWQIARSGESLALIGRTLLPFGVAATVCLARDGWRSYQGHSQRGRRPPPTLQWEYPTVRSMLESAGIESSASYGRAPDDVRSVERSWSKDRAVQPTLERRSPATVQAALRHLAPELKSANVSLAMHVDGDEREVPQQIHDLLTRAIEVALDNVIAHAHAHNVEVVLGITPEVALLRVVDDGIGLFDGTAEPPGFHQIKRLRFRAQELGGALRVDDREEGGVVLEMRVPLRI